MTKFIIAFSISFIIGILLNKYVNKSIVNKIYYYLGFINIKYIFTLNFIISLYFALHNIDLDLYDIGLYMAENNQTSSPSANVDINSGVVKDNQLVVQNPKFEIKMSDSQVRNIADGALTLGGLRGGIECAKHIKGAPEKLLAGAAGIGLTHTTAMVIKKIHKAVNENNSDKNNYISNSFIKNVSEDSSNVVLNAFQYDLLLDLLKFNYFSIFFTIVIFNTYLATYLTKIDIDKYLKPNSTNLFIKLLRYLILRYINLWNKSKDFLFIFSWICLFVSLIMCKVCLFFIIN